MQRLVTTVLYLTLTTCFLTTNASNSSAFCLQLCTTGVTGGLSGYFENRSTIIPNTYLIGETAYYKPTTLIEWVIDVNLTGIRAFKTFKYPANLDLHVDQYNYQVGRDGIARFSSLRIHGTTSTVNQIKRCITVFLQDKNATLTIEGAAKNTPL